MKSGTYVVIIPLLSLLVLLSFSLVINPQLNLLSKERFEVEKGMNSSETSDVIQVKGNADWIELKNAGGCSGEGTYSDPYIIQDVIIDTDRKSMCISIFDSNVYFKIVNTSLFNAYTGIRLSNVSNSMLVNNTISSNFKGIELTNCHNVTVSMNIFDLGYFGVEVFYSDNITVSKNVVKFARDGIRTFGSFNSTFFENNMSHCGILISGCLNSLLSLNIDSSNLVNGKPLSYHVNEENLELKNISDAGQVMLINCNNSFLSNIMVSGASNGIFLAYCHNSTLLRNRVESNTYGIELSHCYTSNISLNEGGGNIDGIYLYQCFNSTISMNSFSGDSTSIALYESCENDSVLNNTIRSSDVAIGVYGSDHNLLLNNDMNGSAFGLIGIDLQFSDENIISRNSIKEYECGMTFTWSKFNNITFNFLIRNGQCFYEDDGCEGNRFENNFCPHPSETVIGYDLLIILGILSLISTTILLKYRKKMFPRDKIRVN
jgi:parallel beta-helix repeat protein